jgi:glutaminyl-peptide cyclotransferase
VIPLVNHMMRVVQNIFILVTFLVILMAETLTTAQPNSSSPPDQNGLTPGASEIQSIQEYRYKIVKSYPHDPKAYTQGLVYHQGFLYESTGQYGHSSLRKVDLETGAVLKIHALSPFFFGEGVAIWERKLVQLTYRSRIGFVYDLESLEQVGRFSYRTQGWGLARVGSELVMSDGSAQLLFLDPDTYALRRTLDVTDTGRPVLYLNELEYIEGRLWANVYHTDTIVQIDLETGQVVGRINLSGLSHACEAQNQIDVLNGIAYDPNAKRLFVTGKLWPCLFEIELIPSQ